MECFETFFYRKFGAVVVDQLSEGYGDLDLLTVLKGMRDTSDRGGPYLHVAGRMNEVGTYTNPEEGNDLHAGYLQFKECTRMKLAPTGYDEKLFRVERFKEPICKTYSSARSLKGAADGMGLAEAQANIVFSNKMTLKIENLEVVKVDKIRLRSIIKRMWKPDTDPDGPLTWKPDTDPNGIPNWIFPRSFESRTKLWVIHEILRATNLTGWSDHSTSTGGHLTIPIIGGGRVEGSVETSRSQGNDAITPISSTEDSEKHTIAFRAICCHFDSAGNWVETEDHAGPKAPEVRGEEDEESNATNRANVCDLFVTVPPVDICTDSDNDEEGDFDECGDLLPLPIPKRAMLSRDLGTQSGTN